MLVLLAGTIALPAAQSVRITVQADRIRFRLQPEIIGANMEDLHYQMVGGLDSQLLHGESFFEPSPTELAQTSGHVDENRLEPGVRRVGGEALAFRSELDPPAAMLDRGLPRACGRRAGLRSAAAASELANLMVWALSQVASLSSP